jgi:hypothetical protein
LGWRLGLFCRGCAIGGSFKVIPGYIRGAKLSGVNIVLKCIYRGIEYFVRDLDDGHWQWAVYPRMGENANSAGVEKIREEAIAACKAEIEVRLAAKKLK